MTRLTTARAAAQGRRLRRGEGPHSRRHHRCRREPAAVPNQSESVRVGPDRSGSVLARPPGWPVCLQLCAALAAARTRRAVGVESGLPRPLGTASPSPLLPSPTARHSPPPRRLGHAPDPAGGRGAPQKVLRSAQPPALPLPGAGPRLVRRRAPLLKECGEQRIKEAPLPNAAQRGRRPWGLRLTGAECRGSLSSSGERGFTEDRDITVRARPGSRPEAAQTAGPGRIRLRAPQQQ